jgi:WD40 repeat protein
MIQRADQNTQRETLQEWLRFTAAQAHVLRLYPQLFFQQAANQADGSVPAFAAQEQWHRGAETRPWLEWRNKPQQHNPCRMTLTGHKGWAMACAYSPDGKTIVTGSSDHTLKLWDSETGAELLTLFGHQHNVNCCAYSPCGRYIVSASNDGTIKVWEAGSDVEAARLPGHQIKADVMGCVFLNRNGLLISAAGRLPCSSGLRALWLWL